MPERSASGITLVETLLASALGAAILVTLLALYQRGATGYAFAENRATLARKVFITNHLFADALHVSGGSSCPADNATFNLIKNHHGTDWLRLFDRPVQISDNSVTVLATGLPVPLKDHDVDQSRFTLAQATPLDRGDLLVICNNEISVLLQVTGTLHDKHSFSYKPSARIRPGNCNSPFADDGCGPENYHFARGALVAPYRPVSFFIAAGDGRTPSLRRRRLVITNTTGGVASARLLSEEVVENVVALRTIAGVAVSADRVRLTAYPGTEKTIFLNVGFVAAADARAAGLTPDTDPHLFGEPVALPGNVTAADHLLASHELSVRL